MCLAVPFRIVQVIGDRATVEAEGVRREISVAFIDDPKAGDHVLIHAGFAIRKWTDEDVADYHRIMGEA